RAVPARRPQAREVVRVPAGRVLFTGGEDRAERAPGGIVMIPPGTPDAVFDIGAEPLRSMATITPVGLQRPCREPQARARAAGRHRPDRDHRRAPRSRMRRPADRALSRLRAPAGPPPRRAGAWRD
ncbi:MAG: hypothetical protein ACLFU0_11870, partial [Alphaproteobacteria bacterium]